MKGCPDFEALSAHVDGEADAVIALHVEGCSGCAQTVEAIESLGARLRAHRPPDRDLTPALAAQAPPRATPRRWLAAAGAVAASIAVGLLSWTGGGVPQAVADEAVSRHLQAFANGRSCETESADPERLEDFFSSSLGRDIEVRAPARGRLVGARRCSLFGERAAAVVYADGDVSVTMFVPPPGSRAAKSTAGAIGRCREARDGQTVCVVGGDDGAPHVLVGGLPAEELGTLLVQR